MDIQNKVFIVTGGASGLGEGTARMLSREGAKVVIADLQTEKGQALAAELGGAGLPHSSNVTSARRPTARRLWPLPWPWAPSSAWSTAPASPPR